MGLLLSKEVRDRILEERNQRKQTLAEFDGRMREFLKAVSQSQAAGTNKLSKRVTAVVKSVDLCEGAWKSAVTSVASVVRELQPALDEEVAGREKGDRELRDRVETGFADFGTELEAVTTKAFTQLEELNRKVDRLAHERKQEADQFVKELTAFREGHPKEFRSHLEETLAGVRDKYHAMVDAEKQKRLELERELMAQDTKFSTGLAQLRLEYTSKVEDLAAGQASLEARLEAATELFEKRLEEAEASAKIHVRETGEKINDQIHKLFPTHEDFSAESDRLRQTIKDQQRNFELMQRFPSETRRRAG